MAKTKRKINKQSVMQKQQWKYMRRRYPFLVPVRHWYTGMKMTKKEIKNTPPILSLESRDINPTGSNAYMGRTALLACPEGGTNLSAMAGLDRSSFNTEPGLRSISFSIFCFQRCLRCAGSVFCFFNHTVTFRLGWFVVY